MNIEQALMQRSGSKCELCASTQSLSAYEVTGADNLDSDSYVLMCSTCSEQTSHSKDIDVNHWRCLSDSMWSQIPAVQVMAWRMLKQLSAESWAQNLLEMLYLEDDVLKWAETTEEETSAPTFDSNGAELKKGDNVTIIKDLVVKGAGFTAKRGTAVRNISLTSNPEQIEGRVNGTRIVLLTCYLKKSS